jgi:NADH-quinone oxidoreductase subunit G
MVKKAREGVMEFLLINHPLDCPICDQGGECDLQDQAMAYGVDGSRYRENKRAVEDKYIGPLVKTVMTRCIQCTRCVRFTSEVAGVGDLGLISRGEDVEITTYLEHAMVSELQGNVVDLCPVGALTSKPYAFAARPWELAKTESIDVMDALGSNIRIDTRGREVMRILPRLNEAVNEEWISDKTRHVVDGLKTQRLDKPYIREGGRLRPATWSEAFTTLSRRLFGVDKGRIGVVAGPLASVEELFSIQTMFGKLGVTNLDSRPPGSALDPALGRAGYLFNSTVAGIEAADAILIVGSNPRLEAPVLNARIRKRWLKGGLTVSVIGPQADLTYPTTYLGAGPESLKAVLADGGFAKDAKRPMVIVGQGAVERPDGAAVLALAARVAEASGALAEDWNGFNVLHTGAGQVGALDLGFVPGADGLDTATMLGGALDVLFLVGADEVDLDGLGKTFVVYVGSHGDRGAHRADIILPGATYTEKSGTYVNTEGRVQLAERANFAPGEAREDWAVWRALSDILGVKLPWDSLTQLRGKLYAEFPRFAAIDAVEPADAAEVAALAKRGGTAGSAPFASAITDFYLTNPIARASRTMAECSALAMARHRAAAE